MAASITDVFKGDFVEDVQLINDVNGLEKYRLAPVCLRDFAALGKLCADAVAVLTRFGEKFPDTCVKTNETSTKAPVSEKLGGPAVDHFFSSTFSAFHFDTTKQTAFFYGHTSEFKELSWHPRGQIRVQFSGESSIIMIDAKAFHDALKSLPEDDAEAEASTPKVEFHIAGLFDAINHMDTSSKLASKAFRCDLAAKSVLIIPPMFIVGCSTVNGNNVTGVAKHFFPTTSLPDEAKMRIAATKDLVRASNMDFPHIMRGLESIEKLE